MIKKTHYFIITKTHQRDGKRESQRETFQNGWLTLRFLFTHLLAY